MKQHLTGVFTARYAIKFIALLSCYRTKTSSGPLSGHEAINLLLHGLCELRVKLEFIGGIAHTLCNA